MIGKIDLRTLSLLMIPIFLILLLTTFSGLENKHDIDISRVFASVLIFFVLVPAFVIVKNENIVRHAKNNLESHIILQNIYKSVNSFKNKVTIYPDVIV